MSTLEERFAQISKPYPAELRPSLVLPLLQAVQEEQGFIGDEDAHRVADYLGVPRMQVLEALSWYSMFVREPTGRHVIKVCRNLSCSLRGSERLLEHLQKTLGVGLGETTADGRFTLLAVECLASCNTAPVMQVNETHHERLTEEQIDAIVQALP